MRGRPPWVVLAATVLAVGLGASLPASAQSDEEPTPTSTTAQDEPTSTTGLTLLPTTSSTTEPAPTTTSTTTAPETTTTAPEATTSTTPPVTLPATTTTQAIEVSPAPVPMPPTTSLPPPADFDEGVSTGTLVMLVIAALVLIATVLSLFTWRFWRSTRPQAVAPSGGTVGEHG